ncbi:MAG: radical SAM protein [Spirochaetia bacterium]|jgi:cyclic pyranopterin phosphate synthase|nr:radical SAM protein [Spirochaetia bacterium]
MNGPEKGVADDFGRLHTYLRLSVTDACNYRCVYCGPAAAHVGLSTDQMVDLCSIFYSMGIKVLRITGGEPTVRSDIVTLTSRLADIGFDRLSMTTNGEYLCRYAMDLKKAGLDSINISLDATEDSLYESLTGGFHVRAVLDGLQAALDAGLLVKLNCVPLASCFERQAVQLMEVAAAYKVPVRFIELMPFGNGARCTGASFPLLQQFLEDRFGGGQLIPEGMISGCGPAIYRNYAGVSVGFITAISDCFCDRCNRLRLTARGRLKSCLYSNKYLDVQALVTQGLPQVDIEKRIREFVAKKPARHGAGRKDMAEEPLSTFGG